MINLKSKSVITLIVALAPISVLIAPYSLFYFPKQEVIYPFIVFILLWYKRNEYLSREWSNVKYSILLVFSSILTFALTLTVNQQLPYITPIIDLALTATFFIILSEKKKDIFESFINILSLLFFLGIIEFLIALFFKSSLNLGDLTRVTSHGDWTASQALFNIFPSYWESGYMRFQSLFDEPGRVGTLAIFALAIIDFEKYKYQYLIILLAGLMSFSLAFYILLAVLLVFRIKVNIVFLIATVVVLIIFYFLLQDIFESLISSRLESGLVDNRTSSDFNKKFTELFLNNDFILGLGNRSFYEHSWDKGNAGVKVFIYQYGLLGLFLYVIPYLLMIKKSFTCSSDRLILIFIYLLSIYQRTDWNFIPNSFLFFMS